MYVQKRKRLLKRFLVFLCLLGINFLVILFLRAVMALTPWGTFSLKEPWKWMLLATLLATLLYRPLDQLILMVFKTLLFRVGMGRLAALDKATTDLMHTLDLKELSNLIVNTLAEVMDQRVVTLVLLDRLQDRYWVASSYGLPITAVNKIHFAKDDPLIRFLKKRKELVEREKCLQEFSWPEVYEISKGFEALGAHAMLSIFGDASWIGLLGLSGKRGGSSFTSDERNVFEAFGEVAGYALRNALQVEELRETNEKLKDLHSRMLQATKLAAIEQLAAGMAHEIHNPLTIISGKAQILLLKKKQQLDAETLEEALKTIVKQTKRAADITRKLLIFSEPKSSGKERISFETVVDDTLALISYQTTLDEITIRKHIPKDLPPFRGEINELREIFLNLILNAVQAVEKRGVIDIRVRYLDKEELVEIKIQDTGKGIPADEIPRLFNPFFTTQEEGLGLGLYITQQIVNRYRGSIHVESEVGQGTVVVIHLPASRGSPEHETEGSRDEPVRVE